MISHTSRCDDAPICLVRDSPSNNTQRTGTDKMQLLQERSPYFQDDGFHLYQGNSLEILTELPDNSVDMIFADPPYNLSNGGFTCYAGKRASVNKGKWDQSQGLDQDFAFHMEWLEACHRILKPEGTIWLSGSYHSIFTCGYALLQTGFRILNDICWFKPNGAPNLSCRYFTASHETLIWAIKDAKAKHTFHYQQMKQGDWHKSDMIKKENKQMRSVWSIGTARGEEKKLGRHPTQKPLSLLQRIVMASTREGDLILDPFTGSSTTGLAAYTQGRDFVGLDINQQYLELSVKRFKHTKHKRLEERTQEQAKELYPEQPKQSRKQEATCAPKKRSKRNKSIKRKQKDPGSKTTSTVLDSTPL